MHAKNMPTTSLQKALTLSHKIVVIRSRIHYYLCRRQNIRQGHDARGGRVH